MSVKTLGALVVAAAATACGGSSSMSAPYIWGGAVTVTSGTTSTTCVQTVTVTYSASGDSPSAVSIPVGGCVHFVNADSAPHWPMSNPHPTHTQCPWLNMAAAIPAGGSATAGPAPAPPMTCGFHDDINPPPSGSGY